MNMKENIPAVGRGRGRGRSLKVIPVQGAVMGPPKRPAPKRKSSSTSPHTVSTPSRINWKSRQNSFPNTATPSHTATSSKSHSSTEQESRIVIALSEGRGDAVCEVGIAAVNIAQPSLILCQISDSQSYINTLTKINILNPSEIIIPLTFIEPASANRLIGKIKEQFQDVKITGVTRSTFNKNMGLQYIKQLCVPSMNSIELILQHRYYALAAAGALLTYTENMLYVMYAKESIKIEYQESEGSTIIDVSTADKLELVASARPTMTRRYSCLLDVLNYCYTKIGVLTLRASILQPPCSVPDIEARLDCVTELKEHSEMTNAIQIILQKLSNIDQLLTLATVLPDQAQNCSERQLNYILLLNSLLEQITPLGDIFENSKQPFFIELRETLSNPSFVEVKEIVRTIIHTDAHPGKGQYGTLQRCFAIKPGVNSLLDLVRKSYSERLDDMREYVKTLGEKYNLALSLQNNYKKGFHIVLSLNAHQKTHFKKTDLPSEFIQVERLSNTCTMKTQDLINLSYRVEDITMDILKMSNIMIYKILIQIRTHVGIFYKLCEDIAKLDMLQSLAQASNAMHYVRPQFGNYLEVVQARHPLLDFLCSVEPIANSMYASEDYNINIITGPNGSGKSIYIRQVVLIQVMAQVGCYVPAESATLRVADRILARIYLEDNMTCGASAFVLEMKEIQYFLTVLTKNTLIIADEPCRSTSVEEGTALAMAICEKLMETPAFVFFTTHFKLMAKLRDLHFKIKTWQLETLTETVNNQMILQFTYNVIPGVTSLEHYGFFLAKGSWHENICKYAEEVLNQLSTTTKKSPNIREVNPAARLKYDLEAEFKALKAKKQLTRAIINENLIKYQTNLRDFGYQVEFPLFSNDTDNNNQADIQQNKNYKRNDLYNENLFHDAIFNSESNFLNQPNAIQDCYQLMDDLDAEETSQNISQILMEQINTNNFTAYNRESCNQSNVEYIHPLFFHGNMQCHQQTHNLFNNSRDNLETVDDGASNCGSRNSFDTFSIASQQLPDIVNKRNNSQNLSYPNIFEPEVILESFEQVEANYSNIQQTSITLQKEITSVAEKSICQPFATISNTMQVHKTLQISEAYGVSQTNVTKHSIQSMGSSCMPQNIVNQSAGEDTNRQINNSKYVENTTGLRQSTLYTSANCSNEVSFVLPPVEAQLQTSTNDDSFLSITELQFVKPLQQNVERTSTPLLAGKCQNKLILNSWNEMDTNHHNFQSCEASLSKVNNGKRLVEDLPNMMSSSISKPSKSSSTNSDSIQWKAKQIKHQNKKMFDVKTVKNISGNISSKLNTEVSASVTVKSFKNNSCDVVVDPDITAALNDLQSCSDSFLDSENWDSIDEEMKMQINKTILPTETSSPTTENSKGSSCGPPVTKTSNAIAFKNSDFPSPDCGRNTSGMQTSMQQSRTGIHSKDIVKPSKFNLIEHIPKKIQNSTAHLQYPGVQHNQMRSKDIFQIKCNQNGNGYQQDIGRIMIPQFEINRQIANEEHGLRQDEINKLNEELLPGHTRTPQLEAIESHSDHSNDKKLLQPNQKIIFSQKTMEMDQLQVDMSHLQCATETMLGNSNQQNFQTQDFEPTNRFVVSPQPWNNQIHELQQNKSLNLVPSKATNQSPASQLGYNKIQKLYHDDETSTSKSPVYEFHQFKATTKLENIHKQYLENNEIAHETLYNYRHNTSVKNPANQADPIQYEIEQVNDNTFKQSDKDVQLQSNKTIQKPILKEDILLKVSRENSKLQHLQKSNKISLADKSLDGSIIDTGIYHKNSNSSKYSENKCPPQCNVEIQPLEETEDLIQLASNQQIDNMLDKEIPYSPCYEDDYHQQNTKNDHLRIFDTSQQCIKASKQTINTFLQLENSKEMSPTVSNTKINENCNQRINVSRQGICYQDDDNDCKALEKSHLLSVLPEEQAEIGNNNSLLNATLEPLGDIHLELFSDDNITDTSQDQLHSLEEQIKNSQCNTNSSPSKCLTEGETMPRNIILHSPKLKLQTENTIVQQQTNINTSDEYETANSILSVQDNNASQDEVPSSSEYFTVTEINAKRSNNDNNKTSKQISKRKQLGNATKTIIKNSSVSENLNICQTTDNQTPSSKYDSNEERDITSELFCTLSSLTTVETPPISTSSDPFKDEKPQTTRKRKRSKLPKFNPPKKLTKKEIELDYLDQDRKMLESENSSQHLASIINRPSVRQLQQASHVASFHKTSSGVVVIPAKESKTRPRKKKFVAPLKRNSQNFDMSLFSDKNSDKFELLMNNSDKKIPTSIAQHISAFEVVNSPVVRKADIIKDQNKGSLQDCGKRVQSFKASQELQKPPVTDIQKTESQASISVDQLGKGYYTQNKTCIDNIVNKYLNLENIMRHSSSQNSISSKKDCSSNIFSQETVSLDSFIH